jgi:hypothetical protein
MQCRKAMTSIFESPPMMRGRRGWVFNPVCYGLLEMLYGGCKDFLRQFRVGNGRPGVPTFLQRINARGVHARGDGGDQERDLAATYRNWARQLAFEYPYVASVVEGIAEGYDREAEMWDSEDAVRRRVGH